MKKQDYEQLLSLPPQEFCDKVRELFPQNLGYGYAIDKEFFMCDDDDIVYIPERSFTELEEEQDLTFYTKEDFLDICDNNIELAEYIFESLEWQYPETYLEELCNNFTDIVIDYDFTKTITSSVAKTLYSMLSDSEKIQVYNDCVRMAIQKTLQPHT